MRTLIMTSSKFEGEIKIEYNENGCLESFTVTGTLSEKQYQSIIGNMPYTMDMIEGFKNLYKQATFINNARKVTFAMMWDRYNDKQRSSKKKSEAKWDKMTESDQIKAYLYYPKYNKQRGTAEKKYLETYLNAELWNNW